MLTSTATLRHITFAIAVLAGAVTATHAMASPLDWVAGERVQGNGTIKKQARTIGHFTALSLSLPGDVELRIGNTEGITIETDDNLLPLIETVIEDGMLQVRPIKRNLNMQTRHMKITLNAKTIERLAVGGSGSITSDRLRGDKLTFHIGGSGSINVKGIDGQAVAVSLGGSGDFTSGPGTIGTLSVNIGGSGDVDAGQLKSGEASVSVAGSGAATVWASDRLSVSIAGSGDVNYYGDPQVSRSVVGSGGTKKLGSAPR